MSEFGGGSELGPSGDAARESSEGPRGEQRVGSGSNFRLSPTGVSAMQGCVLPEQEAKVGDGAEGGGEDEIVDSGDKGESGGSKKQ